MYELWTMSRFAAELFLAGFSSKSPSRELKCSSFLTLVPLEADPESIFGDFPTPSSPWSSSFFGFERDLEPAFASFFLRSCKRAPRLIPSSASSSSILAFFIGFWSSEDILRTETVRKTKTSDFERKSVGLMRLMESNFFLELGLGRTIRKWWLSNFRMKIRREREKEKHFKTREVRIWFWGISALLHS